MARTLNPQLFGSVDGPLVKVEAGSQIHSKKLREIEAQVETINGKLERWVQILDGKIQQLHNAQKNISEQIRQSAESFSQQQALLASRINERRGADVKTQELVDRHNQLIHKFESRITQIQKVTSEQEMKLLTYQATYDEVLREIRSLSK